jgi:hypothetical protein
MMEILEMVLWIIATPLLLFVGLAWLGFILGLLSDPYYGIKELQGQPRERLVKLLSRFRRHGSGGNSDNSLGSFGVDCVGRTSVVVRCTTFGRIAHNISNS